MYLYMFKTFIFRKMFQTFRLEIVMADAVHNIEWLQKILYRMKNVFILCYIFGKGFQRHQIWLYQYFNYDINNGYCNMNNRIQKHIKL